MQVEQKYKNIICAIDTTDLRAAAALVGYIRHKVGAIKLGLEFFTAHGEHGVREIQKYEVPIFLDLKFHDIPNTVAKAVAAAVRLGASMITIHTLGGEKMLRAAVAAVDEEIAKTGRDRPLLLGVTILTSMNDDDLNQIGIKKPLEKQVLSLAELAEKSGLDGIVCSSHELLSVRKKFGDKLKLIVPGIRPKEADVNDQKRVMTPSEALKNGANYLVIGRPITSAKNPVAMLEKIASEIEETLPKQQVLF